MTVYEDVERSYLEATVTKARSLSATLARIDGELRKIADRHAPESCGRSFGTDQSER